MASFSARPTMSSPDCSATGTSQARRATPVSPRTPGSTRAAIVRATSSPPTASKPVLGPTPGVSAHTRNGSAGRPRVPDSTPHTARSSRKRAISASSRTAACRSAISAAPAGAASQRASVSSPGPVSAEPTSWKSDAGPNTLRLPA